MTCEEARMRTADELGRGTGPDLEAHLAGCTACAAESAEVRALWTRLGELPDPAPSPFLSTRFYAALDALQRAEREKPAGFWRWWPSQPVWQVAMSVACLVIGVFAGTLVTGRQDTGDMAKLREEMTGMRQLVTLSLLQQQSATERLRGVTYSYRAEPNDREVLDALTQTVTLDPSVDVRLAAVDALRQSRSPGARRGLVDALATQQSPMVQIAIIDALSEVKERSAAPAMRALLQGPDIDVNVRKRAESALNQFQ